MIVAMAEVADVMSRLRGHDIYFYMFDPGRASDSELRFHFGGGRAVVPCSDNLSLSYLAASIQHFLDNDRFLISWSAKDVFSFLKSRTEMAMEMGGFLYDLSVISSYLSVDCEVPSSFPEAVRLLKRLVGHPGWGAFKPFYTEVYLPLVSSVLPDMETCCLVDNSKRRCVYPSYVVEGQANGRLKAVVPTDGHYNPHSMGAEQKANLRPPGYDEVFVYFDYRNMEVNVLQWLSGDPALGSILESGDDPYRAIWSRVIRSEATEGNRKTCKDVFLPVVFGQGPRSLASRTGIKEEIASRIIDTLVDAFPVAFDWVTSQSPDGDNMAVDFFGRRRRFEERELYKIRNFSVQSPASMICLRKLVRLHGSLSGLARSCFHVHDGYCVVCAKNKVGEVFEVGTRVLEEEDPMFPGLGLRTSCVHGARLNDMKPLRTGVEE
jgi:hypothetical protein